MPKCSKNGTNHQEYIAASRVTRDRERQNDGGDVCVMRELERGSCISQHSRNLLHAEFRCDAAPRRIASTLLLAVCVTETNANTRLHMCAWFCFKILRRSRDAGGRIEVILKKYK